MIIPPHAQTEQTRLSVADKARRSTYVMAGVLGFTDITPTLHLEMCNWIDGPGRRKLGLVPRDHLKTSVWTIANTIRRIVLDPNIRILIGNETATNAGHFLRRVKSVFERNSLFQWLFPEVIPDWSKVSKWSENEIIIPRTADYPEATVETIGVGGAVVSRHYKLIKLDDLVGKEASESADVMQKTIDWYQYCESLLEDPHDTIETYGTRWSYNDLYAWIERHEKDDIVRFFRACYNEESDPIWPERFDRVELERMRRKMGTFKFSCQYLNSPFDPESASFDEKWLRYYDYMSGAICPEGGSPIAVESLSKFMRIDPAISERPGAARSAIVVDGVHSDGRVFLLDAWAKRCQPFEMLEKMFDLYAEHDCISVGVEAVAYQRILKPIIEREAERRGIWVNVVELKPDTREKKENRIRGVQPYFERGLIWIKRDMEDFLEEFKQFPVGKTVDILDAFAYGPHQWNAPMEGDEEFEAHEEQVFKYGGRSEITGY
jgi:predicted phage terminase large subunit-like protein